MIGHCTSVIQFMPKLYIVELIFLSPMINPHRNFTKIGNWKREFAKKKESSAKKSVIMPEGKFKSNANNVIEKNC